MLTTRDGGAATSAPKRTEDDGEASDVGVNDLGDGGGGDVCAEAQPAVGGGSRRPRWRWFGFGG